MIFTKNKSETGRSALPRSPPARPHAGIRFTDGKTPSETGQMVDLSTLEQNAQNTANAATADSTFSEVLQV